MLRPSAERDYDPHGSSESGEPHEGYYGVLGSCKPRTVLPCGLLAHALTCLLPESRCAISWYMVRMVMAGLDSSNVR